METTHNPNSKAAEVLLGLPPIDRLCENITARINRQTATIDTGEPATAQVCNNSL